MKRQVICKDKEFLLTVCKKKVKKVSFYLKEQMIASKNEIVLIRPLVANKAYCRCFTYII